MPLDPRYVTGFELEQYFVNKLDGTPLAGGKVSFFEDDDRIVPKLVYELTGAPPNYLFEPLPNPIILSSVGTIQDAAGNNVALYAYPYDAEGNLQLYYVTVTDALDTPQFTREAWPGSSTGSSPSANAQPAIENQITNPQFADVLFIGPGPLTITIAGAGTQAIPIAPGWTLNVTTTGASTVMLTQNTITGVTAYPFNPPYTLTITPGANISAINISQRFFNNPSIWSPQNAGSLNGFVSASILLAPASSVTMLYAPSQGPQQILLAANNLTGVYSEFNATTQLTPANNIQTSAVGYVDIIIQLPVATAVTLSNIQIVSLETNITNVAFDQQSVNRQRDYEFHYWDPRLKYKPIPSYLVGWDFPLNPTQFLGPTLAASAAGANTSRYVWDQTIVFQSANNGPAVSRGTNGCLTITATNTTQFALVQYLEASVARMILNDRNSVNLAAATSVLAGIGATISLWYSTDVNLPSCAANNSIVATLSAAGKPATFNGNWTEVPRSNLGDAIATVATSATTNFNNYGFQGWDLKGIPATNTATWFAIVIGFASLAAAQTVSIDSISLVPGDIPSRPAPLTANQTLTKCMYYYGKTFPLITVPAQGVGIHSGELVWPVTIAGANTNTSASYTFSAPMIGQPTLTFYSPFFATNQAYDEPGNLACTVTAPVETTEKAIVVNCTANAGSVQGSFIGVHITFDARLGR